MFIVAFIHNSQKIETSQVFTDKWMDKQNVVYISNELLFGLKKEKNSYTCYNMDEPERHAKWNSLVTKG